MKMKRRANNDTRQSEEVQRKRAKMEDATRFTHDVEDLQNRALKILIQQLDQETDRIYKNIYGEQWEEGKKIEQAKLAEAQADQQALNKMLEVSEKVRKEDEKIPINSNGPFLDDTNPRY